MPKLAQIGHKMDVRWALALALLMLTYAVDGVSTLYDPQRLYRPQLLVARAAQYLGAAGSLLRAVATGKNQDVCNTLLGLGPASIKVGQSLASRPDLVGRELATCLQQLQDSVPATLSYNQVRAVLLADFPDIGSTLDLASLSREPVNAASLGQVHKARLVNGTTVAVKIQRPGVGELVGMDLCLARGVAALLGPLLRSDAVQAVDELGARIFEEMDYSREAQNLQLFSALYHADLGGSAAARLPSPGVITPLLIPQLCSARVLTMTWIDGTKLVSYDRIAPAQLLQITSLGIRCSLSQLLETGVLHADPHGGNLMVDAAGRLCYLDFGLVARVPEKVRVALLCAVVHLVNRDFERLAGEFEDLMLLPEGALGACQQDLARALEGVVSRVFAYGPPTGDGGSSNSSSSSSSSSSSRRKGEGGQDEDVLSHLPTLKFDQIVSSLGSIVRDFPFQSPPYFLNNVRAIGTLEGMALSADKDFNLFRIVYPFMVARLFSGFGSEKKVDALFRSLVLRADTGLVDWVRTQRLLREACALGVGVGGGGGGGGLRRRIGLLWQFARTPSGARFVLEVAGRYLRWGLAKVKTLLDKGYGWVFRL